MRWLFVFLMTCTLAGLAQQVTPSVQATSSGVCSPNVVSNQGPVTITCNAAMDKATVTKIVSLLNRIVREEGSSDEVNRKLDSILEFLQTNVNPNKPTTVYDCSGNSSTTGHGVGVGLSVNATFGGTTAEAFLKMIKLNNTHQYAELLTVCNEQLKAAPAWLTPHLFCSLADLGLGHTEEAWEALRTYDQKTGPAYDGDSRCKQASEYLHSHLKP